MTNILQFHQKPQAIVERLGIDHDGRKVYAATFVDEEGGRALEYVGPSYPDAMLTANEWLDGNTVLLDRVHGHGRMQQ
jgi:hypothetical protein